MARNFDYIIKPFCAVALCQGRETFFHSVVEKKSKAFDIAGNFFSHRKRWKKEIYCKAFSG
jgi:hypothetical protein